MALKGRNNSPSGVIPQVPSPPKLGEKERNDVVSAQLFRLGARRVGPKSQINSPLCEKAPSPSDRTAALPAAAGALGKVRTSGRPI
jgi:hypothetical protein